MRIIAIYPGRFQPFGPHHKKVYEWMVKKFGKSNSFVVTSDKTDDDKSPLNFQEKKQVIEKFGILSQNIVQVTEPYKAKELLQCFNPMLDSCVFVLGQKDLDRIKITEKSYFKEYNDAKPIYPFLANGYIIKSPHFLIEGEDISGTSLRQNLPNATPTQFQKIMGWYDPKIHQLFQEKFQPEPVQTFIESFVGQINEGTITRTQLKRIEQYADQLFLKFGLDINFQDLSKNTHFFQRLNDPRNETPISQDDLRRLFKKTSLKYGMKLGKMNPGAEGVLKDMESDINLPFIIKWDRDNQELDLVPKTIMRKKDFKTQTQLFQMEDFQQLFEAVKNQSGRKHIFHPYEDLDLTFNDLRTMICQLLDGKPESPIYEKIDGQALEICYRNGAILVARNKGERINPLNYNELVMKFQDHENKKLKGIFGNTLHFMSNSLLDLNQETLTKIFPNPNIFLGLELCYPQNFNVFKYSNSPFIVLHGLIQYDAKGNETGRYPKTGEQVAKIINDPKIKSPNQLNLSNTGFSRVFQIDLDRILEENGLNYLNKVADLKDKSRLERIIHLTGVAMLKRIGSVMCENPDLAIETMMDKLQVVKTRVLNSADPNTIKKFGELNQKFEENGGLSSLVPLEGFVFNFKGKTYKITGNFRYINLILGFFRYKR